MSNPSLVRRHFSLSNRVKELYPGSDNREKLCWELSVYYSDAIDSRRENPVIAQVNHPHGFICELKMSQSTNNDKKVRVDYLRSLPT